jgi:hypothetical protein
MPDTSGWPCMTSGPSFVRKVLWGREGPGVPVHARAPKCLRQIGEPADLGPDRYGRFWAVCKLSIALLMFCFLGPLSLP